MVEIITLSDNDGEDENETKKHTKIKTAAPMAVTEQKSKK